MEGRFSYSLQRPNIGNQDTDPLGYIDLNFHSDCRVIEKKIEKCPAKFCFRIKDQGTSMILFATTEQERSDWMEIIQEATRGMHHFCPSASFVITRSSSATNSPPERMMKRQLSRSSSAVQMGYKTVEYPKMAGPLKKKSIEGKTLGFKNTKSRYLSPHLHVSPVLSHLDGSSGISSDGSVWNVERSDITNRNRCLQRI
jgi:hypothetical protein